MSRRDQRPTYTPPVPDDELSLEAILAEYGRGGRQPAPDTAPAAEPAPAAPSVPESVPDPKPAPAAEPEPVPEPKPTVEPESVPEPEDTPLSDVPDRVSLKDVMNQTVESVLEESEDGVLDEPVPLGQRLAALLHRFTERGDDRRRGLSQETEQLFDEPEDEPEPEEPEEPEPRMDDALREEKRRCNRLRRGLVLGAFPALLLVVAAVLQELEVLPPAWLDAALLRCAVLGGGLLLTALLCLPVWQTAYRMLRDGRVGCELCAGVTVLADLLCCVSGIVTGSTLSTPYAAAGALLILSCQLGLYLTAETRRIAFHLADVNGVPPYVVSVLPAGVCKQRGVLEGFYRTTMRPDPARQWQNYVLPLLLSIAVVLSGVVCFTARPMEEFPWVLAVLTGAGVQLSLPLTGALPLYYLSRRLERSGAAAAGYAGAKAVARAGRIILTDDDLFPAGTVALNGYKVYGEERVRAVSYAAAVSKAAGSSLAPLLDRQLTVEGGYPMRVDELRYCEEGGVEAAIRGETVLMGSAYFMKKRRIALPRDLKMETGVFMTVDGRLAAIFAVKYLPSRNVEWALRALRRNRVTPVLATRGVNITPNLLKRKFRLNARPIYPGVATRLALADLTAQPGETPNALIYRDGLLPMAETVIGSQRMCQAVRWSTILSWIGGLCGLVLSYYLTTAGDFAALSPLYMLAFLVLLLLPTLLLSGLVKYY